MKNLSRTSCSAPASSFRYAERRGLRSAAGARANQNPNLNQDLQTFLQNLTHTTLRDGP